MSSHAPIAITRDNIMHRLWAPFLLVLSLSSLIIAGYGVMANRAVQASSTSNGLSSTPTMIAQPKQWVPLSADLAVTHADGRAATIGRYFRDAHGCTRMETGPAGEVAVIYIQNVPRSEYYSWSTRLHQWTAGPMKLPTRGWIPIERREGTAGLERYPLFVEGTEGETVKSKGGCGSRSVSLR